ncbi:hypothetical protein SLI_7935 [Streptomyces lividans 1326]|uniref:Uncharacterized protein n=1 Tax=Streptomyces lividans 1326 TaxID=1200984 RepID=A0A7U9HF48_STRLI|nr:hypothetical protein SLI_7935 [Streptomyces lividans 1326]
MSTIHRRDSAGFAGRSRRLIGALLAAMPPIVTNTFAAWSGPCQRAS